MNNMMFCSDKIIPFMPLYPQLANAYVPYQYMNCVYSPNEALDKGTLFPELYRPYTEESCGCRQIDGGVDNA